MSNQDDEKADAVVDQVDEKIPIPSDDKVPESGVVTPKDTATIDTVHNDEALKILAAYTGDETWTDAEEKKLRRRVDWVLMPILCTTYGLQYYDKAMLSQAALFGLMTDLQLATSQFAFSASIFYIGFVIGAYPAMVIGQKYPIERVASIIVTIWGVCLILTPACYNYKTLYVQRFFLGFLESGVSPMFMMIVGSWYKKDEQAMRMGLWYSFTGISAIFAPLINYGFGLINGGTHSWRYMYYFAGALTILWGLLLWLILPPDPTTAKGFDDRERYILLARLRINNAGVRNTHFKIEQLWEVLLDVKFWLAFSMALLCMIANGPVSSFSLIIIAGFGFDRLVSLLLLLPAAALGSCFLLGLPYLSMKFPNIRIYMILVSQFLVTLGALLLWQMPMTNRAALLVGTYLLPIVAAGYAVLMGLVIANTAGYTKRSVMSSGLFIGYCLGNIVGPLVFKQEDAPRYVPGFIVVVVTSAVTMLLAVAYRLVCMWQNKARDRAGISEGFDHAYEDDLTDMKNPQFRYVF